MSELKPTEESDTIELERKKEILEPMFEKVQTPTQNDGLYEEILPLLIRLYNTGYRAGHEDTVEGGYTDVFPCDMDAYHDDFVEEWCSDTKLKHLIQSPSNPQAVPKPSLVEAIKIVQEAVSAKVYRLNIDSGGIVLRKPKGTVLRMSPKQLAGELGK